MLKEETNKSNKKKKGEQQDESVAICWRISLGHLGCLAAALALLASFRALAQSSRVVAPR